MTLTERHAQAWSDYEYLTREIGQAQDETGGWLPDEQLPPLLKTPSKKVACGILISYIDYWFNRGPDSENCHSNTGMPITPIMAEHPRVREIADTWGITSWHD